MTKFTLASRWQGGLVDREPFIRRARDAAHVSLPHLQPRREGEQLTGQDYGQRYSSRAAKGVTNLASKMTLGHFPPGNPFHRYEPDLVAFVEAGGSEDSLSELMLELSRRERTVQRFLDSVGLRASAFSLFENLIVSGSYLFEQQPDGSFAGFRLDQFQIQRDGRDRVIEIRIKERVQRRDLPEEFRDLLQNPGPSGQGVQPLSDELELHTNAQRIAQSFASNAMPRWRVRQEVSGIPVGAPRDVADDRLPWIPVRFFKSEGEHYGRSLFDLIQGEVEVVEGLTQALVEDAAMGARGVWAVDPASGIDLTEFLSKDSGEGIYGKKDGAGMIRADKGSDLQFAAALLQGVDQELASIFMAFTPRPSERTTASEIDRVSQEINEAFGGAFSLLEMELQRPLLEKTERRMLDLGSLAPLPDKLAPPRIVTGMDAIGRGRDEIAFTRFIAHLTNIYGPKASEFLENEGTLTRIAAMTGLDPEGIVLPEEARQAQAAQDQQNQFLQRIGPAGMRILEKMIAERSQQTEQ